MNKVKISEIAQEMAKKPKEVLDACKALNISAEKVSNSISLSDTEKVIKYLYSASLPETSQETKSPEHDLSELELEYQEQLEELRNEIRSLHKLLETSQEERIQRLENFVEILLKNQVHIDETPKTTKIVQRESFDDF